jgi:uncharacterized protein YcbX
MHIESLYRYPVKGLTPEPLTRAHVEPGCCLPWDRAFALVQGDCAFDDATPTWWAKRNFMCLLVNAKIAALQTRFDDATSTLTVQTPGGDQVTANPLTPEGRAALSAFFIAFLGAEARPGPAGQTPHFAYVPAHSFCDQPTQVISLIGLGSLRALEDAAGRPCDKRRFRANIYIEDLPAWAEFGWVGRRLAIGTAELVVQDRTERCGATSVNPDTAARDANPVKELMQGFGHTDLGVFAEVTKPGMFSAGDKIKLLPV